MEHMLNRSEARAGVMPESAGGKRFAGVLSEARARTEARANTQKSKFEQWFTTKNSLKAIGVISALGLAAGVADAISPDVAGGIGESVHKNILQPVWDIVKYPFKGATLEPIRKEGLLQLPPATPGTETALTRGIDTADLAKLGSTEKAKIWANSGTGGPVYRFINDLMSKLGVADAAGIAQSTTEFAGGITTAFTGDTLGGYTDYKHSGKLLPVTGLVGLVASMKAIRPIERYRDWADVKEARAGGMGFGMNLGPRQQMYSLNNIESALVAPPAGPV